MGGVKSMQMAATLSETQNHLARPRNLIIWFLKTFTWKKFKAR
jgi:hypothetical protein